MDNITIAKKGLEDILNSIDEDNVNTKEIIITLNELSNALNEDEKISLPAYKSLSIKETKDKVNKIISLWNSFIASNDATLCMEDVDVDEHNLCEVIERVNKRKVHYQIYHNINELSEIKETALLCFWIVKLKPFTILKKESPLKSSENEYFAIYLIFSILQYLTVKIHKEFNLPSDSFIKDAIYILKYRELSKEAMILFVSSIAQNYGISIDSLL